MYRAENVHTCTSFACYFESLKADGNVCYLGVEGPGIMAIVDGTECPPTFGAGESMYICMQ